MLYRGERFTFHVECILGGHGIMSAYAKAASALIVTAINGDPSREQPSWSEYGDLDSRDRASADKADHASGVHHTLNLHGVNARCLVGAKKHENTGRLHVGHALYNAVGCSTAE
jgi:hypothetical protein